MPLDDVAVAVIPLIGAQETIVLVKRAPIVAEGAQAPGEPSIRQSLFDSARLTRSPPAAS